MDDVATQSKWFGVNNMYIAFFSAHIKPFTAHRKMNVCDTVGEWRILNFLLFSHLHARLVALPFSLKLQRMYDNWIFLLIAPKVDRIVRCDRHECALVHQELNLNNCTSWFTFVTDVRVYARRSQSKDVHRMVRVKEKKNGDKEKWKIIHRDVGGWIFHVEERCLFYSNIHTMPSSPSLSPSWPSQMRAGKLMMSKGAARRGRHCGFQRRKRCWTWGNSSFFKNEKLRYLCVTAAVATWCFTIRY